MRSFDEVMAFRNEFVLDVFRRDFLFSDDEIEEIFVVLKQWLYLAARHRTDDPSARPLAMPPHIIVADHMWHTFMLSSAVYVPFCDHFFGRYIHHQPVSWSELQAVEPSDAAAAEPLSDESGEDEAEELDDIAYVMSVAYDLLGPETTTRWFTEIPATYPRSRIERMRRSWQEKI